MALDSTAKAIATQAWTQLLHSTLSKQPPFDMSKYYFSESQITDSNHFEHNLKRLEIYKYKIGTENIRARMSLHSEAVLPNQSENQPGVQANEDAEKQGMEHIRYSTRSGISYEVVQANEDGNQLGMEHIQYSMRSGTPYEVVQANEDKNQLGIEDIQYSMRSCTPYEVVQANEDKNQQGIEHIQYCTRSSTPYEVVQANQDVNQLGIEHIQYCMRSGTPYEAMQANEDENQQGIELVGKSPIVTRMPEENDEIVDRNQDEMDQARNILAFSTLLKLVKNGGMLGEEVEQPIMEPYFLAMIANFHEMEPNSIQMVLEEEPDTMNQKYYNIEYLKKQKELLLKIFDTENCQLTICKILREAGRDCSVHHHEVMKAIEEGNQHNIKHIPYCIRHTVPVEVVRAFDHTTQQYLRFCLERKCTRSTGLHKVLEETEDGIEQPMDRFRAKRLLNSFGELLELVQFAELHENIKAETSLAVLRLMKLLYHYGLDTIKIGVEEELKEVKQKCDDVKKDPAMQCKHRLLETMLRICDTKTCQRTIYQIICKEALQGQMP